MCDWTKEMIESSGVIPKQKATVLRVLVVDDHATNTEDNASSQQRLQQPAADSNLLPSSTPEDVDNDS